MGMNVQDICAVLISYLVGAIPFGFIIVRIFFKKDIRNVGSKNPGATNVWRSFGKTAGISTLVLDVAKGALPVFLTARFLTTLDPLPVICGMATIMGHNWSIFLLGKGGKGVATSGGVFLALIPKQFAICVIVFIIVLLATKHVSLGSMAAAATLMTSTFIIPTDVLVQVIVILAGLMILIKHVPNMKRLIEGKEAKVKTK